MRHWGSVGVARALAADPPVLLMDEPFGAVDPVVRTQLQDELLRLQKELNKTIVFVTHDIDEAVRLGDRIAIFRTGGHLVQCAPPTELLARPADDFVADFLGAERGLKLLSLKTLAEVPPGPGAARQRLDPHARRRRQAPKDASSEPGTMQNALTLALPAGLQVLPYSQAADSDCFVVTRETARKYGLVTLADLAKQNGKLVIGAAPEVKKRRVGAVGLKDLYGVEFKEFKSLDSDGPLVKGALKKGDVDVANLFTTDTDIAADDWGC